MGVGAGIWEGGRVSKAAGRGVGGKLKTKGGRRWQKKKRKLCHFVQYFKTEEEHSGGDHGPRQ